MTSSSYNAAFGTYPNDIDLESLPLDSEPLERVALFPCRQRDVFRFSPQGIIVKEYYTNMDRGNLHSFDSQSGEPLDVQALFKPFDFERIWNIMELAGDCCVPIVGRAFRGSNVVGFCTPIESPIDTSQIATKEERIRIIYQLRDVVAKLHSKNIVHGDISPANLLMRSDGQLHLCDFDDASIEGDGHVTTGMTFPYCSPFRIQNMEAPKRLTDDLYATGLLIWEIYTGRLPLIYGNESKDDLAIVDLLENRCRVGFLPDMALVDDPDISALIQTCLDAARECTDVRNLIDAVYCVETRFSFGYCKEQPSHLYSRITHGWNCHKRCPEGDRDVPCENPFLQPNIITSRVEPTCPRCIKSVEFVGITG
ncbi:kinase-like domain-containing protein [Mycena rebaudengoi]|nr:kinase-like domain-containing protein [Mycena rebaudengoi]